MKKALFFFATFFLSLFVTAQSSNKVSELGLVFSNADQFGLTYRVGNEHALWRFNALSLGGSINTGTLTPVTNSTNTLSFGLSVGREYRIPINNIVDFRYGADLTYSYSRNYTEENYSDNIHNFSNQTIVNNTPGINLVFGLNFKLKYFIIGAELKPNFQYNFGSTDTTEGTDPTEHKDQTDLMFSLSNLPVQFSVVYPF